VSQSRFEWGREHNPDGPDVRAARARIGLEHGDETVLDVRTVQNDGVDEQSKARLRRHGLVTDRPDGSGDVSRKGGLALNLLDAAGLLDNATAQYRESPDERGRQRVIEAQARADRAQAALDEEGRRTK